MMDPRAFGEATRTISVGYPVPFVLVALLGFALSCFVLRYWAAETVFARAFVSVGVVSAVLDPGLIAYAVLCKPELLRSEKHTLAHTWLEWLAAADQDEAVRESASKVVIQLTEPEVPKRFSHGQERNKP